MQTKPPHPARMGAFAVLVFLGVGAGVGAQEQPAASAQEAFAARFGKQWEAVKQTPETKDDIALGRRMFHEAQAQEETAYRDLLMDRAYELFLPSPEGLKWALSLARAQAQMPGARKRGQERVLEVLDRMRQLPAPAQQRQQALLDYAREMIAIADDRLLDGQVEQAQDLYARATQFSGVLSPETRQALALRSQAASQLRTHELRCEQLAGQIPEAQADKPRLVRQLALLLLVELNRPDLALEYVGPDFWDPVVGLYMPLAALPVDRLDPNVALELARWYDLLAKQASPMGRAFMGGRALVCYQRYLSQSQQAPEEVVQRQKALALEVQDLPEMHRRLAGISPESVQLDPDMLLPGPLRDERAIKAAKTLSDPKARPRERNEAFVVLKENYANYQRVRHMFIQRCLLTWPRLEEKLATLEFLFQRYPEDQEVHRLAKGICLSELPVNLRVMSLEFLYDPEVEKNELQKRVQLAQKLLASRETTPIERAVSLRFLAKVLPQNNALATASARLVLDRTAGEELRLAAMEYLVSQQAQPEKVTALLLRITGQEFSTARERQTALGVLLEKEMTDSIRQGLLDILAARWVTEQERLMAIEALSTLAGNAAVVEALQKASAQDWRSQGERDAITQSLAKLKG